MIHCATNDQFTHLCKESELAWLSLLKEGMICFSTAKVTTGANGECSYSANVDGGANLIRRYCFESRATFINHK